MNPRGALHQRSDSDTNAQGSSAESASVSPIASRSASTTSTRNSKQHKSQKSQTSVHSSSTGTTSRSNTSRSGVSLDSLPPVPPLRIHKQRRSQSFSVYQDSDTGTTSPAVDSRPNNEGPQKSPTTRPRAPIHPRSILKKPSVGALPPYTEDDYRYKSRAWVGSQVADSSQNRPRMNAQTLRLVNNAEASAQDQYGDEKASFPAESSIQGQLRVQSRMGGPTTPNANDALNSRPSTPLQASAARQFPDWARYFYGKKGGRASVIDPQVVESANGQSTSSPNDRPRTAGSMALSEIPRYFQRAQPPRDPDTTTLWSLPHLDRVPTTRVESLDRQLILFCLGFVLPLCWWIAAFLPLPSEFASWHQDVEAQGDNLTVSKEARQIGVAYEQRYKNARWWQRLNRILSVVGLMIVGVVIALVVLATHAR